MNEGILWKWKQKPGIAILISDEIDFKTKAIKRERKDPAFLLGIYLKKTKHWLEKIFAPLMFTAVLLPIAMKWKQTRYLSTDEWLKKGHTHTNITQPWKRKKPWILQNDWT